MHTLVTYYSKYGNTKRIAEEITQSLNQLGLAELLDVDELSPSMLQDIDLLVIGSPTYYQAVPKDVRLKLKSLPKRCLKGKWVAAYDTSLKMWQPLMLMTAAHGMMAQLRKLGGKKLVKTETFVIRSGELPEEGEVDLLEIGEMERVQEWIQRILQNIKERG